MIYFSFKYFLFLLHLSLEREKQTKLYQPERSLPKLIASRLETFEFCLLLSVGARFCNICLSINGAAELCKRDESLCLCLSSLMKYSFYVHDYAISIKLCRVVIWGEARIVCHCLFGLRATLDSEQNCLFVRLLCNRLLIHFVAVLLFTLFASSRSPKRHELCHSLKRAKLFIVSILTDGKETIRSLHTLGTNKKQNEEGVRNCCRLMAPKKVPSIKID